MRNSGTAETSSHAGRMMMQSIGSSERSPATAAATNSASHPSRATTTRMPMIPQATASPSGIEGNSALPRSPSAAPMNVAGKIRPPRNSAHAATSRATILMPAMTASWPAS